MSVEEGRFQINPKYIYKMPITHQLLPDYNLTISTHTGVVPDDEFVSSYQELLLNNEADLTCNRLIDLRDTDSDARSANALRTLGSVIEKLFAEFTVPIKVAVVAPSALSFGLSRMFEGHLNSPFIDFHVFEEISPALEWLEVPDDLLSEPGT